MPGLRCNHVMFPRLVATAAAAAHLAFVPGAAVGGTTEVISLDAATQWAAGGELSGWGGDPGGRNVSADGRYVAFASFSSTFGPTDGNGRSDVYLRDRLNHVTKRISVGAGGKWSNGNSIHPTITPDGRFVAFESDASTLVAGDTNRETDVFVRDRRTGRTERVSISTNGTQYVGSRNASISDDGRYVAFESHVPTGSPPEIFVRDRLVGTTRLVSVLLPGAQLSWTDRSYRPSISGDGRYVAFESLSDKLVPNDTNGKSDIFVRDLLMQTTERVTTGDNGEANRDSFFASISADGRYVTFETDATNLVEKSDSIYDVIVHDRQTGRNELISVGSGGAPSDGYSFHAAITADGRYVAFASDATNIVPGDTNGQMDVFLRDRQEGVTERVSVSSAGEQGGGPNGENVAISSNGRFVAFDQVCNGDQFGGCIGALQPIVPNDGNADFDVYLRDRGATANYSFTLQPNSISFGGRVVSSTTTKSFWLHNTSSTSLQVLTVELRGTDRALFSLARTCGAEVTAGGICRIDVAFRPTMVGDFAASLHVVVGASMVRNRAITGSGVASSR